MNIETLQIIGIALGLGLLVGLQREYNQSKIAGIRTFPLVTLFGAICGLLSADAGGWIIGGGILAVAILVFTGNFLTRNLQPPDSGQTTEAALLLMFGIGAYLSLGDKLVAVVTAGTVAVLLHLKSPLHNFIHRFGRKDIRTIMQFVLISLIILPLLPNETFGPYQVLNLQNIWLMVVLIVGLSIAGYFGYKILGQKGGIAAGGLLGGLISSTATTVSYSRLTKSAPGVAASAAFVVMAASAVAFIRVLAEVAIIAPQTLPAVAPPLLATFLIMAILTVFFYWRSHHEAGEIPEPENPAQLKAALIFAAVYALVILGTAAAKDHFGQQGLFGVAILSGLTDMDAITLSTARLMRSEQLSLHNGWRMILTASLANLAFKCAIVAVLGNRPLLLRVAAAFAIAIAGGLVILFLWPEGWRF